MRRMLKLALLLKAIHTVLEELVHNLRPILLSTLLVDKL